MPSSTRPTLPKLATPVTGTFPPDVHSATVGQTPLSAVSLPVKQEPADYVKTPISPPLAYTDFLTKAMLLNSPHPEAAAAAADATAAASGETTPDSEPSPANSDDTDPIVRIKKERPSPMTSISSSSNSSISVDKLSPPATAAAAGIPPSPFVATPGPMSAPPTGPATFPSMRLPPSPAVSHLDSPASARSPFSARSVNSSVFDWDAALKARFADQRKQKTSRTSVRHIREVVTRTVTYTPKMDPAPKGKRRKISEETHS